MIILAMSICFPNISAHQKEQEEEKTKGEQNNYQIRNIKRGKDKERRIKKILERDEGGTD